jgi:hypothetical protein
MLLPIYATRLYSQLVMNKKILPWVIKSLPIMIKVLTNNNIRKRVNRESKKRIIVRISKRSRIFQLKRSKLSKNCLLKKTILML